jgi:hypothetical protein
VLVPLEELESTTGVGEASRPEARLRLETVRDAVGVEMSVIIEILLVVLREYVRDTVGAQVVRRKGQSRGHPP